MPLYILGPAVVLGIGLIALLTHLLGFSRRYEFVDSNDARARWLREWPSDQVSAVVLSDDRHAALVDATTGQGLVWAFGADTVAKRLTHAGLREDALGIRFDLRDYSTRHVQINLGPAERADWLRRIKGDAG